MLSGAKSRAKQFGLDFDIELSDIEIPELCPVLGILLEFGGQSSSSPSLDRMDNTKGYVKGNVRVISHRANMLKSNMNLEECRKILLYLEEIACKN